MITISNTFLNKYVFLSGNMSEQVPTLGIIGGSGLERLLPGKLKKSPGPITGKEIWTSECTLSGIRVISVSRHGYLRNYSTLDSPYEDHIAFLKLQGVDGLVLASATGTIDTTIKLAADGSIVISDNLERGKAYRTRSFAHSKQKLEELRLRQYLKDHPSFDYPFDNVLRGVVLKAAEEVEGLTVYNNGIYILNEGECFESSAEIASLNLKLRLADTVREFSQRDYLDGPFMEFIQTLHFPGIKHYSARHAQVGMTALHEVELALELDIPVIVICSPVNPAAGMREETPTLFETLEQINGAEKYLKQLIPKIASQYAVVRGVYTGK